VREVSNGLIQRRDSDDKRPVQRYVVPVAAVFHASTAAYCFRLKQVLVKGRFYFALSFEDAFNARTD
jgi:hypothetical protein